MALVLGTNCGFVTAAPVADPEGSNSVLDAVSYAFKVVIPEGITTITEIGWWCDTATEASNFEVGLYEHYAVTGLPTNRLYVSNTNAKGTDAGWKSVNVTWEVTPTATYWLAVQLDNTATQTNINITNIGGSLSAYKTASASLTDPWVNTGNLGAHTAIYAIGGVGVTYSELSGTIAGVGTPSGNLEIASISELSGTIAGVGAMSGNLGSVLVHISSDINYKRLVVVGSNGFYYEDI